MDNDNKNDFGEFDSEETLNGSVLNGEGTKDADSTFLSEENAKITENLNNGTIDEELLNNTGTDNSAKEKYPQQFCPVCGLQYSVNIIACPRCGFGMVQKKKISVFKKWWFWLIIILAVFVGVVSAITVVSRTRTTTKSMEEILLNPEINKQEKYEQIYDDDTVTISVIRNDNYDEAYNSFDVQIYNKTDKPVQISTGSVSVDGRAINVNFECEDFWFTASPNDYSTGVVSSSSEYEDFKDAKNYTFNFSIYKGDNEDMDSPENFKSADAYETGNCIYNYGGTYNEDNNFDESSPIYSDGSIYVAIRPTVDSYEVLVTNTSEKVIVYNFCNLKFGNGYPVGYCYDKDYAETILPGGTSVIELYVEPDSTVLGDNICFNIAYDNEVRDKYLLQNITDKIVYDID